MSQPSTDRTQEGYLVDFKATWSDSALRAVPAFANTFGGLLLVGVSDKDGRADQIVGIASQRQELKTSIASSIASRAGLLTRLERLECRVAASDQP